MEPTGSATNVNKRRLRRHGGKLSARFRRMNILLFTAAICIIAAVMMALLSGVITKVSSDYAEQFALSTTEALSAHISKEIGIVSYTANSDAVTQWMSDEGNEEKKARALMEMAGIVGGLYSYNMYIVFNGSLNQYRVGMDYATGEVQLLDVAVLNKNEPGDAWYFESINSGRDYMLDVGIDQIMQRKRVWLDYNVVSDGILLGVISTGLEFSHVVGELFSQYDRADMRGLIIDENGVINMDSALMRDNEFLFSEFAVMAGDEISDHNVLSAIRTHIDSAEGNFSETGGPVAMTPGTGQYRIVTISQIRSTSWLVVILSGGSSLFDITNFVPILLTVLVLLIVVALISSTANYRLIFRPLGKLEQSLSSLGESIDGSVSGTERDDELGDLSRTIQDLFTKANIDTLTGIYNRRFMENHLDSTISLLSRSNGFLSILMLDIDYFKKYNDAFGHDQGDVCLKAVAQAMSKSVTRSADFIARYGGEEFIAILPNTEEKGAMRIAERIRANVIALEISHPDNAAASYVTVSIGVASGAVVYGKKREDYIKRADMALYLSKQDGRNQSTFMEFE